MDLFAERMQVTSEHATGTTERDGTEAQNSEQQVDRVHYFIGDGWHRFQALRELGQDMIPAIVHAGGRREVLKFALGANATHGLRRTNKDKRKAVTVAIKEFPTLSNRAIADLCRVHHSLVDNIRPSQLADSASSRIGKDGKVRRVVSMPASVQSGSSEPTQLDFFELLGREWTPVVKSFDLTIRSVAWLDDRVMPEKKLEALSAMRRQLDDMRAQLAERERAIKAGIGSREPMATDDDGAELHGSPVECSLPESGTPHNEDFADRIEGGCA